MLCIKISSKKPRRLRPDNDDMLDENELALKNVLVWMGKIEIGYLEIIQHNRTIRWRHKI